MRSDGLAKDEMLLSFINDYLLKSGVINEEDYFRMRTRISASSIPSGMASAEPKG